MADVVVTSIHKYIIDSLSLLPRDLSVYVTFDKKVTDVTTINSYVPESVASGSTTFKLYSSDTDLPIEQSIIGLTLTDELYSDSYSITNYGNGIVTLSTPLLRDLEENEKFTLSVKNTLKVIASPISLYDRTQPHSRSLKPRLKFFDLIVGTENDSNGATMERLIRWLNLVFSKETYRCYDSDGDLIGINKFYINDVLSWTDVQPNVNNKIFLGRVGFLIYEDISSQI